MPGRVCIIAGNHDESLKHRNGRFVSEVEPGEFAEQLNRGATHAPVQADLGLAFIRLVEQLPRAIFFEGGLLAAHGGIPLRDIWETRNEIQGLDDFERPSCLQDFTWIRAHDTVPKKLPNRTTKSASFGFRDFEDFCVLASKVLGRPVRYMVRGHDHVDEGLDRYALFPRWKKNPVLTINSLSYRLDREPNFPGDDRPVRHPAIARWHPGGTPDIHRLRIPEALVRKVHFPRPTEGGG